MQYVGAGFHIPLSASSWFAFFFGAFTCPVCFPPDGHRSSEKGVDHNTRAHIYLLHEDVFMMMKIRKPIRMLLKRRCPKTSSTATVPVPVCIFIVRHVFGMRGAGI